MLDGRLGCARQCELYIFSLEISEVAKWMISTPNDSRFWNGGILGKVGPRFRPNFSNSNRMNSVAFGNVHKADNSRLLIKQG